ncbi:MAG: ribosome-binding factor A [Planctomycetes bacterium]|jgi:ribosome-binding factor A|nr:ribosome-binding factor A [Planctomycetota bacterium]
MSRIPQVNETIKHELALIINRHLEIPNVLVTITYVNCSTDLDGARIAVSVLPFQMSGTVLKQLNHKSGIFAAELRKRIRLRRIPHFYWRIDNTEEKASELEEYVDAVSDRDLENK